MSPKKQFLNTISAICLALSAVLFIGCNQNRGGGPGGGQGGNTEVKDCKTHDNNQAACDAARQTSGEKCYFQNGKCIVPSLGGQVLTGKCIDFNGKKDDCGKKIECEYDDAASLCKDSANPKNCANVKDETYCKTTYGAASLYRCAWVSGACQRGSSASIVTYTLTKLDRATEHGVPSNQITGLTAAGNGSYVYLFSQYSPLKSKAATSGAGLWQETEHFLNAADHTQPVLANTLDAEMYSYFPYETGVIFTLKSGMNGRGLVVLNGSGQSMTSHYPQITASGLQTDAVLVPFFATKAGADYLYAFNQTTAANGVSWRIYTAPDGTAASNDTYSNLKSGARNDGWNDSLRLKDGNNYGDLIDIFTAAAQVPGHGIFLGYQHGIRKISENDIAEDNGSLPLTRTYTDLELSLDGRTTANNQGIIAMASFGSDSLLVGFKSGGNDNKGGLVVLNLSDRQKNKYFGARMGISVNAIVVARHGRGAGEYAVVSTDKGMWILDKATSTLREPVAGEGNLIDTVYIRRNRAIDNDLTNAVNGFKGHEPAANAPSNVIGAGQMANGLWYFAIKGADDDDGGVFTLDIADVTINP